MGTSESGSESRSGVVHTCHEAGRNTGSIDTACTGDWNRRAAHAMDSAGGVASEKRQGRSEGSVDGPEFGLLHGKREAAKAAGYERRRGPAHDRVHRIGSQEKQTPPPQQMLLPASPQLPAVLPQQPTAEPPLAEGMDMDVQGAGASQSDETMGDGSGVQELGSKEPMEDAELT